MVRTDVARVPVEAAEAPIATRHARAPVVRTATAKAILLRLVVRFIDTHTFL